MSDLPIRIGSLALTGGLSALFLAARHWPTRQRPQFIDAGLAILEPLRPQYAAATPVGVIPMGFRYCPEEQRTVAVFLHGDGTATCADPDCGAYIPGGQP